MEVEAPSRIGSSGSGSGGGIANDGGSGSFFWMGKDTLKVPMRMHADNRSKLRSRLQEAINCDNSLAGLSFIVLLQGGESKTRYCTDHEDVFRQESYFAYLFGVTEPDFYGAIDMTTGRSMLFMPRLPASYAVWMGALKTPQEFQAKYGVDEVHYTDQLLSQLTREEAKDGRPILLLLQGLNTDSGSTTHPAHFKAIDSFVVNTEVLHPVLSECRVIKSEDELRVLRYAAAVSSDAHVHVMRTVRPGMMEYELEAAFQHYIYSKGGCRLCAYTCICACGPNGAVLHYGHAAAPNDRRLENGDMALLDMGAEYACYAADITCSFPVNGRFSDDQRMVYGAVLAAQKAVLQAMRPGVSWIDMHRLAERTVLDRLLAAGVVTGSVDDMMAKHVGALFMPHGLGHFFGLDTHDVGGYNGHDTPKRPTAPGEKSLRTTRTLQPGMAITVEPGCYFIDALLLPALQDTNLAPFLVADRIHSLRGTGGVRLEDDVIVTETGVENLTGCPREIADVEAVMAGGAWPSAVQRLLSSAE